MERLRRLVFRLLTVWRRDRAEADLAREVSSHLALLQDEFQRRGLTPDEARLAARRAFGGVEQTKELQRDARSFRWLDDARQDVPYAARLLRRDPVFAATAAVSLAIGIGANTTVFTIANALLFRPPAGVVEPNRLVDIGSTTDGAGFGTCSYLTYLDIRRRTTSFDGVYAYSLFPRAMSLAGAGGGAERVFATDVTTNYFTVLGALPAAGRLFDVRDKEDPGASPIAVLSDGFWTRRFNRDRAIVGGTLTLNGHPFVVVGVASAGFQGTGVRAADVWIPLNMVGVTSPQATALLTNRAAAWLLIGGRLKAGVSVPQADAEMNAIGRTLQREYPDQNRTTDLRVLALSPVPGNSAPIAAFLAVLMGIASVVLAIACANLAGVLLARAAVRRREIAVRLAMGAGRARLVRQLLARKFVRGKISMAGQAVGAMQGEVFVESRHAEKFLQRGFLHARGVAESHVIVDQGEDLLGVLAGEAQAATDFFRHFHADVDVPVEANAIRGDSKSWRLPDVMQQCAPGESCRARLRQIFQQQQRVHEHVAFGMELRRLRHTLHGRNLRQNLFQQPTFVEQQKSAPGLAFGQHASEFVADPFAGDNVNLVGQLFDCGEGCRLDRVSEPRRKAHRPQHPQFVLLKPPLGITDGANDFGVEVFASADKVEHLTADRIEHHAVYGEVAAGHVLPRIRTEVHFVGMTAIRVAEIAAEGGDFHSARLRRDQFAVP